MIEIFRDFAPVTQGASGLVLPHALNTILQRLPHTQGGMMTYAKFLGGAAIATAGAVGIAQIGSSAMYEYHDKQLVKTGVLLKILPKESTDIKETEKLIKNLHKMLLNTKFRKLQYGRPYMSFEIAGKQGKMNFYMWVPKDMKDRIVDRMYAAYPEIALEVMEKDYIPVDKDPTYTAELKLGFHHTQKLKSKLDQDILASILSSIKDLDRSEFAAVQILIRPLDNKWQIKGREAISDFDKNGVRGAKTGSNIKDAVLGAVGGLARDVDEELAYQGLRTNLSGTMGRSTNSANRKSKFDRKEITVAAEKLMEPGFETVIRIVAKGKFKKGNTARVKAMSAAFSELDDNNRFKNDYVFSHSHVFDNFQNRKNYLYGKENILVPSELASFFLRLPGTNLLDKFSEIEKIAVKQFAPPKGSISTGKGIIFAKNTYRGKENIIEIKDKDLMRHIVVQGKTGSGKSEWFKTVFRQHISNIRDDNGNIIRKGRGAMVLEPHGKLADELIEIIPEDRRKDVIFFDLLSDYPLPLNFCKVPDRDTEDMTHDQLAQKTVDEALEIFQRAFSDVWSEKNGFFIKNAIKTIMETGDTMLELPRLFNDKEFRKKIIPQIKDPKVKQFWTSKFKENAQGKIDSSTESTVGSVEYKLEKFLDSKEMMRSLGQNDCIDFKEILDNDKIIIFRLAKKILSKDRVSFIGGIAVKLLIVAAFARDRSKWDTPFLVGIDEAQNFINESIKDILYELRKYGIGLILMHQEMNQMKEVKGLDSAIYNNVGTSITFQVGDMDAPFFESKYGPRVDQDDLKDLPSRYGYCKLLVDGTTSDTFNIYSMDSPKVDPREGKKSKHEILEYNKEGRMHVDEIDKIMRERFNYDEYEEQNFAVELDTAEENEREGEATINEDEGNSKTVWD